MPRLWRVLTGAVMLVVLLGLPVAPVWCELACPQDHARTEHVASHEPPPCHEAEPGAAPVAGEGQALAPVSASDCDHPVTMSARMPDARVALAPPVALVALAHLASLATSRAGRRARPVRSGPAPPRGPTFSPVLRI